jgi:hypothetical protein
MRPYLIRMNDETVTAVDEWRRHQEGEPCRADAIRRLIWRAIRADKRGSADSRKSVALTPE